MFTSPVSRVRVLCFGVSLLAVACATDAPDTADVALQTAAAEHADALARAVRRLETERDYAHDYDYAFVRPDGTVYDATTGTYAQRDRPDGTFEAYLRRDGYQVIHRVDTVQDWWDEHTQTHVTFAFTDTASGAWREARTEPFAGMAHAPGVVKAFRQNPEAFLADSTLRRDGRTLQVFRLPGGPPDTLPSGDVLDVQELLVYVDVDAERVVETVERQVSAQTGAVVAERRSRFTDYRVPLDSAFARPQMTLERLRYRMPAEEARFWSEAQARVNRKGERVAVGDTFPLIGFVGLDERTPVRLPPGPATYVFGAAGCGPYREALHRLDSLGAFAGARPRIATVLSRIIAARDRAWMASIFPRPPGPPLPVATARAQDVAQAYGIIASPTFVTVDGEGVVTDVHVGSDRAYVNALARLP